MKSLLLSLAITVQAFLLGMCGLMAIIDHSVVQLRWLFDFLGYDFFKSLLLVSLFYSYHHTFFSLSLSDNIFLLLGLSKPFLEETKEDPSGDWILSPNLPDTLPLPLPPLQYDMILAMELEHENRLEEQSYHDEELEDEELIWNEIDATKGNSFQESP